MPELALSDVTLHGEIDGARPPFADECRQGQR